MCLEYVTDNGQRFSRIAEDSAIMFCYFNNVEYFHQYLDNYTGIYNVKLVCTWTFRKHETIFLYLIFMRYVGLGVRI